jgi:hypothetical protein
MGLWELLHRKEGSWSVGCRRSLNRFNFEDSLALASHWCSRDAAGVSVPRPEKLVHRMSLHHSGLADDGNYRRGTLPGWEMLSNGEQYTTTMHVTMTFGTGEGRMSVCLLALGKLHSMATGHSEVGFHADVRMHAHVSGLARRRGLNPG